MILTKTTPAQRSLGTKIVRNIFRHPLHRQTAFFPLSYWVLDQVAYQDPGIRSDQHFLVRNEFDLEECFVASSNFPQITLWQSQALELLCDCEVEWVWFYLVPQTKSDNTQGHWGRCRHRHLNSIFEVQSTARCSIPHPTQRFSSNPVHL